MSVRTHFGKLYIHNLLYSQPVYIHMYVHMYIYYYIHTYTILSLVDLDLTKHTGKDHEDYINLQKALEGLRDVMT